jgi:hypothetical protein
MEPGPQGSVSTSIEGRRTDLSAAAARQCASRLTCVCTPNARGGGAQPRELGIGNIPSAARRGWCPGVGGRTTKRPKEPAVRQLAHLQSRLLAIIDVPPGPSPTALRSSVRSPGAVPEIAPQASSTNECRPLRARFRMNVRSALHKGLVHQLASRARTCPPNEGGENPMWISPT